MRVWVFVSVVTVCICMCVCLAVFLYHEGLFFMSDYLSESEYVSLSFFLSFCLVCMSVCLSGVVAECPCLVYLCVRVGCVSV